MYPVVFFDALRVKIRDDAVVRNKAVYLALAILPDGSRDVLGIWIEQTEGARFWLKVSNELRGRGVNDILHRTHKILLDNDSTIDGGSALEEPRAKLRLRKLKLYRE